MNRHPVAYSQPKSAPDRIIRATLRRDERWPVCPLRAAMWDYGLVALGVICTIISITAQFA